MAEMDKEVHWTTLFGTAVALPQHEGANGVPKLTGENNPLPVQIEKGASISNLVTGALTVSSVAKEIKAGDTALSNRNQIMLHPPDSGIVYWGNSAVTASTGFPLEAGQAPVIFDVNVNSPKLYVISDGTDRQVRVVELA